MSTHAATMRPPALPADAMKRQPRWDPARFPPAVDPSRLRSDVIHVSPVEDRERVAWLRVVGEQLLVRLGF